MEKCLVCQAGMSSTKENASIDYAPSCKLGNQAKKRVYEKRKVPKLFDKDSTLA